jgi:hypothetical protein
MITLPILEAAWALTLFYANQWRALDLEVGTERDTRDAPYIDKVLKALRSKVSLSERDICRSVLQRVDADVRKRVLSAMLNDELIKADETVNGTRKTIMYRVA